MANDRSKDRRKAVRVTEFSKLGEAMGMRTPTPSKKAAPPLLGAEQENQSGARGGQPKNPAPPGGQGGGGGSGPAPWPGGLPLRAEVAKEVKARWSACHPGLAFAKFADTWKGTPSDRIGGPEKKDFLEKIVRLMKAHERGPGKTLYDQFLIRRNQLLDDLEGQEQKWVIQPQRPKSGEARPSLSTQWRLVSGLGIAHPFETGFVFDRTYGMPYLPGSSVKGAARAWAEETWGRTDPDVITIFGPEDGDLAQGAVVFFDAYPAAWPELEVDILNPHYKSYYEGTSPPADWLSPEPTYFLTVKLGQPFFFAVGTKPDSPGEEARTRAADLANKAWTAVKGAARELGLGGKTAVGYGYLE